MSNKLGEYGVPRIIKGKADAVEQVEHQASREFIGSLLTDYRKSYKFSQGNMSLQVVLFTLLRDEYEKTPDRLLAIPAALTSIKGYFDRFTLPPHHLIRYDITTEDFEKSFYEFKRCLIEPSYFPELYTSEENERLVMGHSERIKLLLEKTTERDLRFINSEAYPEGRPGVRPGDDPFESYLRTYVLEETDTHTDAYNAIFQDARRMLIETYPDISGLAWSSKKLWERKHPGEGYYPQTFINELEAYG